MGKTIEQVCRELGVAEPKTLGDMLPAGALTALFRDNPSGVYLWVTDAFHQVTNRIPPESCFRFWKSEVQQRLMEDGYFLREAWPRRYAYLAQQWASPFPEPLIELNRCD